ncbi:MAG: hypothetical protein ACK4OE_12175 [Acidovorax sp.]|uniref:hypothetical protein n=1 Tax=Acidovorax sp. TaxID=1872122 RepID=UPI00391DA218
MIISTSDSPFEFPADLPVPTALSDLLRAFPALCEPGADASGSFAFHCEPPSAVARYFGEEGHVGGQAAARHLGVFGVEPDGSTIAIWRAPQGGMPVVYLSSEGGGRVLASDAAQFLRLLGLGYDEFSLYDNLDEPPEADGEVAPELLEWLGAQGLSVPETGEDILAEAEERWPDFDGWMEDAIAGRLPLDDAAASGAQASLVEAPVAEGNLWDQMLACIGRRIDDPLVQHWLSAVGAKPLRPATPHNNSTYVSVRANGIEVSASMAPKHRGFWPPSKDGRLWRTYVTRIALPVKAAGLVPLPDGLSWGQFPGPEEGDNFVKQAVSSTLELTFLCSDAGNGVERIDARLPTERCFMEASADYEMIKHLVYVEDAFLVTWCALQGLLDPERYPVSVLKPWHERTATPLQLLHGPCGRVVWTDDLAAGTSGFWRTYYMGFDTPDAERWVSDVNTVFQSSNHFRDDDEAMTPDSWEAFDRIAPKIARRFNAWRRKADQN